MSSNSIFLIFICEYPSLRWYFLILLREAFIASVWLNEENLISMVGFSLIGTKGTNPLVPLNLIRFKIDYI